MHVLQAKLLEQNTFAQENICKALVDAYANFSTSRRYLQDVINKRNSTIAALLSSYDTYDDLLGKANKGIEFYNKLETNVSKLLQRIRSACKVQEEEREQMLAKVTVKSVEPAVKTSVSTSNAPKLKDYLDSMKKDPGQYTIPAYPGGMEPTWSPGVRPAPLGSEMNVESALPVSSNEQGRYGNYSAGSIYNQASTGYVPSSVQASYLPTTSSGGSGGGSVYGYNYGIYPDQTYASSYQQQLPQQQPSIPQQSSLSQQVPGATQQSAYNQQSAMLPPNHSAFANQASVTYSQQQSTVIPQLPTFSHQTPSATQQPYTHQQLTQPQQMPLVQPPTIPQQQPASATQQQSTQPQQVPVVQPPTIPQQQLPNAALQSQAYSQQQSAYIQQTPQSYSQQLPTVSQQAAVPTPQPQPTPPPPHQLPPVHQQQTAPSPLPTVSVPQQQAQTPSAGYAYPTQSPIHTSVPDKTVDDILSERMAALLSSKKRTTATLNEYPTNQYAQFGYNPQTTPTYSATNYSYPAITQAYTITSSYQQLPASQPSEYSSSTSFPTTVSESANYSVPLIAAPQYSVPPSSTPQPQPYPAAYTGASASYTNYMPQNYGAPSQPSSGVDSLSYSANAYNGQQGYYQGYQSTDSGASSQPYVYGSVDQTSQYAPTDQNPYQSYYSQNSSVPQTNVAYADNSYAVYTQAGTYYNYYENTTTATTASTYTTPQMSTVNFAPTEKTSNIDLLSGLDFTVSQVPLTPQPTTSNTAAPVQKEYKEETKPKTDATPAAVSPKPAVEKKMLEVKKPQIKLLELPKRNLLENPETFNLFVQEVEKYEKFVDTLTTKTLNGPTTLEVKWKEILDKQDADVQKRSISVARCYPMKNRSADILPYDYSRVELVTTKDDYINASHIRDITPYTPPFIVTQCPMTATVVDFWTMVWEQQVELIACLLNDTQVSYRRNRFLLLALNVCLDWRGCLLAQRERTRLNRKEHGDIFTKYDSKTILDRTPYIHSFT